MNTEKIPAWDLGEMDEVDPSGYIVVEHNGNHSHCERGGGDSC